jgi:predicted GIY-YIG superfamily endonuclease
VYIVTDRRNGTVYTGVTSDLVARIWQHREGALPGFTRRYGCKRLVWFEIHEEMLAAIAREKQIKAGCRADKVKLIDAMNPEWRDLWAGIVR